MLNSILNGTRRNQSVTARSTQGPQVPSKSGISIAGKKGDNFITVHANGNDYIIENMTLTEFNAATRGYTTAQQEEFARMHATKTGTTTTGGGTTPPPTDGTTTPPPTDTGGGTTTEEESDNTLMYILIAAIVGVALFPTGKKKKKKK